MHPTLTRRSLLIAGAGALVAAGLGSAARVVADPPALSTARRATYGELADAVATGPAMRLAPGSAAHAADVFATHYATWPAQRRAHADAVLDRGRAGFASREALALAAVTIGPDDDGRAPLSI
jgi:hypothetical protein